jgi:hypothetical protein
LPQCLHAWETAVASFALNHPVWIELRERQINDY